MNHDVDDLLLLPLVEGDIGAAMGICNGRPFIVRRVRDLKPAEDAWIRENDARLAIELTARTLITAALTEAKRR